MSAKAWERLAGEALADALEWKARARDAEASRAELLAALEMVARIWSRDQTANIASDSPLAIVRAAIAKAKGAL